MSWIVPEGDFKTGLYVVNSLTREKNEFVPKKGNTVRWYTCGPTVYDETHVGHARNYVGTDIIRRIMEDYFHYSVCYVMNITDVDDKIIVKGNYTHLVRLVEASEEIYGSSPPEVLVMARNVVDDPSKEKDLPLLLATIDKLSALLGEKAADYDKAEDFNTVARKYESGFFEDMETLNVRPPDAITRVTEHMNEITEFVSGIMDRKFAYLSDGSVYFDTVEFSKTHQYGKLQPSAVGNVELFEEAEGALSLSLSEKKNPNDFALWKKSKEGEPAWDSPWGPGRPGWHIECSAMGTYVLGDTLDIHSGGVDLKFPHHDNEVAQSEAYFDSSQWVNYFIHMGHLHIKGLKMSRSKKNFFTVKEILDSYSPRHIRMFCLLHRFDVPVDFTDETMNIAVQTYKSFEEFFMNVRVFLRDDVEGTEWRWHEKEKNLSKLLLSKQGQVDAALKDSFNTPIVVGHIQELIKAVNIYMGELKPHHSIIRRTAEYISYLLRVFGFSDVGIWNPSEEESVDKEAHLAPYMEALSTFRDRVREAARNGEDSKTFLKLCDELRDDVLPPLGVRLEDKGLEKATWKLCNAEELMKEREREKEEEDARRKAKELAKKQAEAKQREKLEKGKLPPEKMFLNETDRFSAFGDDGMPARDVEGQPLPKSQMKKLQKQYKIQQRLHEQYLKWMKEHGEEE